MSYSNEDLVSFLEGTAPKQLALEIERDMALDPALEDRIMSLDPLASQVSAAFDILPDQTRTQAVAPSAKGLSIRPLLAAAVVGAAVVFAGSYLMDRTPEPDWRVQVANYQALYSNDTVAGEPIGLDQRLAQTALAGARINLKGLEAIPSAATDLTHVRTQILEVDGAALAQIVLRTQDGTPIALCGLLQREASAPTNIELGKLAELTSATFETDTHSWLLIGEVDADFLKAQAEVFQTALESLTDT